MNLARLTGHLTRRHQFRLRMRLISLLRAIRVLLHNFDHAAPLKLDDYRYYVLRATDSALFYYMSNRDYLMKGLSTRERMRTVLSHYEFEECTFDAAYKNAVYNEGGLPLWEQTVDHLRFSICLDMTPRTNTHGDLTISLLVENEVLHWLSFSWIEGAILGIPTPVVPFIAHNDGRWSDSPAAFAAFVRCFPNNLPSFFCFAAMQGLAQTVGIEHVVAVKCTSHVAYDPLEMNHFAGSYDSFWKVLGGMEVPGGWLIKLPFYLKPLTKIPSKHRKRTAQRREYWRAISSAARSKIQRHLIHFCADEANARRLCATSENIEHGEPKVFLRF